MNWKLDFSPETSAARTRLVVTYNIPPHSLYISDSIICPKDDLHMMIDALCR